MKNCQDWEKAALDSHDWVTFDGVDYQCASCDCKPWHNAAKQMCFDAPLSASHYNVWTINSTGRITRRLMIGVDRVRASLDTGMMQVTFGMKERVLAFEKADRNLLSFA